MAWDIRATLSQAIRFKSLQDLALDVVGRTVARVPVEEHMANYRAARARKVN